MAVYQVTFILQVARSQVRPHHAVCSDAGSAALQTPMSQASSRATAAACAHSWAVPAACAAEICLPVQVLQHAARPAHKKVVTQSLWTTTDGQSAGN